MIVILGACQQLSRGASMANSGAVVEGPGAASVGMERSASTMTMAEQGKKGGSPAAEVGDSKNSRRHEGY